eukprot:SAG25_NODE_180_length_12624_cov_23.832495_8_plen_114_part_00
MKPPATADQPVFSFISSNLNIAMQTSPFTASRSIIGGSRPPTTHKLKTINSIEGPVVSWSRCYTTLYEYRFIDKDQIILARVLLRNNRTLFADGDMATESAYSYIQILVLVQM